ncbi:universal stress protein [Pontibacter cellulosilyticus]|uniref:Universal stress protein n=1 Tax=Pontibacter cellulosilyticus TaxID=1720253 RepID=A0A923SIK1_9BACT|nr:universal stress protein [Pontibacter cellulosilyticus]MBC5991751.1 universal stress protein [Pontibacter cellulosilyticus]
MPTDFSKNAYTAMRTGLLLAKSFGAEVVFMHAMSKPMVPATSPEEVYNSLLENEIKELHEKLRRSCHALYDEIRLHHSEVMKQVLVVSSPLPETILQVAANQNIDLVVMGAGGINSMKSLLFGSNTLQMIGLTNVPLLIVPEKYVFKGFHQIYTVVRTKDLGYRDGYQLLLRFARNFSAALKFLVIQKDEVFEPHLSDIIGSNVLLEEFRVLKYQVLTVSKIEVLQVYKNNQPIDLFAWLPNNKSFWSDTFSDDFAEEVLTKLHLPLLIIPPEAKI